MFVMEGMGATLPVTSEAAQAISMARLRAFKRAGASDRLGFGDIPPLYSAMETSRTILDVTRPPRDDDFLSNWGIPIGAGLGGLALGLVMAKTLGKKKGRM